MLQAPPQAVDRPRRDHVEAALGGVGQQAVEGGPLVAALGAADTATETVEVKVGQQPWAPAGSLDWLSVTRLEKAGGTWRRTADGNRIEEGTTQDLVHAKSPDDVVIL